MAIINNEFKSLQDFGDFLEAGKLDNSLTGLKKHFTRPAKEWNGNLTYDQAINYLKNGMVQDYDLLDNMEVFNESEITQDVSGLFNSVPAYLSGDPLAFLNFIPVEKKNLTIILNPQIPANMKAKELKNKYKTFLSCIMAIEQNEGIKCKIIVKGHLFDSVTDNNLFVSITIKDFEDRINLSYHSFAIGHISFCRVLLCCYYSLYSKKSTLGSLRQVEKNNDSDILIDFVDHAPEKIKELLLNRR